MEDVGVSEFEQLRQDALLPSVLLDNGILCKLLLLFFELLLLLLLLFFGLLVVVSLLIMLLHIVFRDVWCQLFLPVMLLLLL
jgi:hypothetical protein